MNEVNVCPCKDNASCHPLKMDASNSVSGAHMIYHTCVSVCLMHDTPGISRGVAVVSGVEP